MRSKATISARRDGGFTLIEMIVTLLVIGIVMSIAVVGVNALTQSTLREDCGRLASVIRASYVLAATTGRTHRLVFDLDNGKYHVESTEDPVLLSQERERALEGQKFEQVDRRRDRRILGIGPETPRAPQPGWQRLTKVEIGLIDPDDKDTISLNKDVEFEGVFTTHQIDVYTRGTTEMYFFPSGWAERAVIYLREKGKNEPVVFSVEVDPLTGGGTIHNSKIRLRPEDFEERGKEEEGEAIF
jgi:general secretion pathway protein H